MPAFPFRRTAALLLLLGASAAALAGPYETGSTSTAKGLKFKSNVQLKHSADKDTWVLPKIGVGGPLADNLELSVGTGYGRIERTGGRSSEGLRDLSVGMKWRLLDERDGRPALAIGPSLNLPTGDRASGIGKGAYALSLPVRLSRRLGDFRVTGEASLQRTFGRDADQAGAGLLLEYVAQPRWSCGIELVADAPREDLGARQLRLNVGAKQRIGRHLQWQALAGRTVDNPRGGRSSTVKLALEYLL
ncbi:transporter [Stenotrophomonas mori]|uniref:Transporter n=1 Tax=Stenotrophomonas mori TaxID=2871096 RepID=A0ABT0SK86_9GAMM|nr:transporter [Stenotrophomonas mori]MCL7715752.1 transporter [Stenotrophomonas mori]